MNRELVIEMTPFGARAALMRHGELMEMRFADSEAADIRGQIFLARVRSLDNERDAAFVDCGRGVTAYLSGRDGRFTTGKRSEIPLHRQVTEGEAILVQGLGMSRDGKKPRVTSDIQLTGMFHVYRPRRRSIKVSNKLSDTGQSERLIGLGKIFFPKGGVIFRGAAAGAADDELETESAQLKTLWDEIEAKAADSGKAPICVFERKDPLERILHEALGPDIDRIIAADHVVHAATRKFLKTWLPALEPRLECQPGAFEISGVNEQLEHADAAKVELKGGGNIVIEQTAALTAIDVNSGGNTSKGANLEAAKEIARQVRLRRIGGTIVVDFIDLKHQSERSTLMSALDEAFAGDPAAVKILPPTLLGLVQISRQRLGQSLDERLQRACPACAGGGRTVSLRAATERMLGQLAEQQGASISSVHLAVDLYGYIVSEATGPFKAFIGRHGLPTPELLPDETLSPGAFRIA